MPSRSILPTLAALSDDLRRMRTSAFTWDHLVHARRTLPAGESVEAWYLAGLFLRTWANEIATAERQRTMAEGSRPIGVYEDGEQTAGSRVDFLADELAHDKTLDSHLAQHLELLADSLIDPVPDSRTSGGLVRAAVETHEWCVLLAVLHQLQRQHTLGGNTGLLRGLRDSLRKLTQSVQGFRSSLSAPQRGYAAALLRHYRRSTLAFSWMPYCKGVPDSDIEDPLFPTKRELAVIHDVAKQIAREFDGMGGLSDLVRSVVERIARAICEMGYAAFAGDLASPDSFPEPHLGGLGQHINVIPGDDLGRCAPLLVVIATAGRKSSLAKLLPQVRQYLINCDTITKGVIIVTDEWTPRILGDSLGDLKSHAARGKKIVFLLAPRPGNEVVHMPISLF